MADPQWITVGVYGIVLWGCLNGALVNVEGIMNSSQYQCVLFTLNIKPNQHKKNQLNQKKIQVLERPSRRPNLNPTENLWADLKMSVSSDEIWQIWVVVFLKSGQIYSSQDVPRW